MAKMVFVLVLSFGSVALGYIVRQIALGGERSAEMGRESSLSSVAKWIKLITLGVLSPWPILFTFWQVEQISSRFLVIPVLGVLSLAIGGASAIIMIRITRMEPVKAGSLFACGMMTNLGVIGGLIGMLFYGNDGYLTVQLFTMFEVFIYYLIVFPLSQQIGSGGDGRFRIDFRLLLSRPMALLPLGAIIIGSILRWTGAPAPDFLNGISGVLVPSVTGLIGFAIGLTLKVSRIRLYRRETAMVSVIKFLIIPAVIIPLAALFGIHTLLGGVAFRMVIFLSFCPVAMIAMVPPQLFDLDLDLANSGWFVTTAAQVIIIPVLILILA